MDHTFSRIDKRPGSDVPQHACLHTRRCIPVVSTGQICMGHFSLDDELLGSWSPQKVTSNCGAGRPSIITETGAVSGDELRKISHPPKQNKRKASSAINVGNDDEGPFSSTFSSPLLKTLPSRIRRATRSRRLGFHSHPSLSQPRLSHLYMTTQRTEISRD
ncbi:MAG: hypothetical protein FRX48_02086 [Lasallia pustulata]|uniref:Uncharacterized protein n=1 Tax=Lasallia pustulata TaxID=136370 RepID=A0A5M8PVP4_9LECA|nr:MAG: hypothetical protein FRX48_02086 [Lasallia pustulata]